MAKVKEYQDKEGTLRVAFTGSALYDFSESPEISGAQLRAFEEVVFPPGVQHDITAKTAEQGISVVFWAIIGFYDEQEDMNPATDDAFWYMVRDKIAEGRPYTIATHMTIKELVEYYTRAFKVRLDRTHSLNPYGMWLACSIVTWIGLVEGKQYRCSLLCHDEGSRKRQRTDTESGEENELEAARSERDAAVSDRDGELEAARSELAKVKTEMEAMKQERNDDISDRDDDAHTKPALIQGGEAEAAGME